MSFEDERREYLDNPIDPANGDVYGSFTTDDERRNILGQKDYVDQLIREQEQASKDAARIASGNPFANTLQNQRIASDNQQAIYRQNVGSAAEKGLMHSGALNLIQAQYIKGQALASIGLMGQEIQTRQQMLEKLQGGLATMKEGEKVIPTTMDVIGQQAPTPLPGEAQRIEQFPNDDVPVFVDERKRIADNNLALTQAIAKLSVMPPSERELNTRFQSKIEEMFSREENLFLQQAQQRGLPADAIEGLRGQLAQEKQNLYDVANGLATELSSNDPQRISAALTALNTQPIQSQVTVQSQSQSPLWGIIPGIVGGVIGGIASEGNPLAIGTGYQIGSGLGQTAGSQFG